MNVPSVGFNYLTVSIEEWEILMSTSVCDVLPIVVFGSVVGFQSVRFLFSYMMCYFLVFPS